MSSSISRLTCLWVWALAMMASLTTTAVDAANPQGTPPAARNASQAWLNPPAGAPWYGNPAPQGNRFSTSPPYSGPSWLPGGYEGRVGAPYYYSPTNYYGPGNAYAGFGSYYDGIGYGMAAPAGYGGFPPPVAGYGGPPMMPGTLPADPYAYHFGPGYYRNAEYGHYSFPWYSYRRPWYFPGHPSYNRDTNLAW